MQWYSSPNAAITTGSYKLRPSNTTGVRSEALMASKSGVRNSFHSVTMANVADRGVDRPFIACIWCSREFEGADLLRVHVQAHHAVAHFGAAGAGDEADAAGADDGDFHAEVRNSAPLWMGGLLSGFALGT